MGRISTVFFFILSLLPAEVLSQERDPVTQVKSLIESCKFSQAASLAERFLLTDSTSTDLLLLVGRARAAEFRYREAIMALQKARQLDSSNILVLNELVNVYKQSGDPKRAIGTNQELCSLAPGERYFSLQLATLYIAEGEFRNSAGILLPLYTADSSSFVIAKLLGTCYNEMKQADSAILFYRKALRLNPYDPFVIGKLVNVFIHENEEALALYWTQRYLQEQDSSYVPVLKQSGYCYYLLKDFNMAARQFRTCTLLGDSSKFTMKYLGLSYYKQEKYDTAAPWFRSAFYSDTTDAEVCFYYGVSANRSLATDTGLVYLHRTLRLLLPSGQFLSTLYCELADANTSSGKSDTAVVLLQKALEANPENNALRFKIAYQFDYHLRKPYDGLPYYREFLKQMTREPDTSEYLPQQVSYSDYARRRIREIMGRSTK